MAISHAKSAPVADFAATVTVFNSQGSTTQASATDLVRPVDWNSAHNITYPLGGTTTNQSTAGGSEVQFDARGGGITIGGSTGTLVFSVAAPDIASFWNNGVGPQARSEGIGTWAPGSGTSNVMSVWPFVLPERISAGFFEILASVGFTSNTSNDSGKNSGGISVVFYQRDAGANSTNLTSITGTALTWHISFSSTSYTTTNNTSFDYTGYGYGNGNSNATNWASGYTGVKLYHFPMNVLMTPGQYWVGILHTMSTSSYNSGKLGLSFIGNTATNLSYLTRAAPPGSFTSDMIAGQVSNAFYRHNIFWGMGSFTTANLNSCPASLAMTNISTGNDTFIPMAIWRT